MSHFICYYSECRYAECLYYECCYAECRYPECHYAECHYVECRYPECRYAECRYVECHYAECRSARQNDAPLKLFQITIKISYICQAHRYRSMHERVLGDIKYRHGFTIIGLLDFHSTYTDICHSFKTH